MNLSFLNILLKISQNVNILKYINLNIFEYYDIRIIVLLPNKL